MSFLQMSLAGAMMILVVAVMRARFMHKIPQKTFVVLWGLVIVRLLLPFDIAAPTSIFAIGQHLQGTSEPVMAFEAVDSAVLANTRNIYTWHYAQTMIEQQFPAAEQVVPALPLLPLLTIVWLVGMVFAGVCFTVLYLKQRRTFLTSLPIEHACIADWQQTHRLKRTIRVRVSDQIASPLTYGIISPVILLPKHMNWSDENELAHILAHEWIHIKRFDALKKLFLTAVLCVHWFNPLVWLLYLLFNRDLELSCDEGVIRLFGEEVKPQYARTLLDAQEQTAYPPLYNAFGKYAIEERIHAIMRRRKASLAGVLAACLLVANVTMLFATSAVAEINYDLSARIIVMTEETSGDGEISAEEAAMIIRTAFSRYYSDFARDWEAWNDITFVLGFSATEDARNPHEWGCFSIWRGLVVVDVGSGLGHNFPLSFAIHAQTGQVIQICYTPRTRYALAVEAVRVEGQGSIAAMYEEWGETYVGFRQGSYDDMFGRLARRTAEDLAFFDSEIVSVYMHGRGAMMSGPIGIVRVEYASGDMVQLEFLLLERDLVSVTYLRNVV